LITDFSGTGSSLLGSSFSALDSISFSSLCLV
jgi:hypothetical protein